MVFCFCNLWILEKRLYDMGIEKQNIESSLIKTISENILLIKEIISMEKKPFFKKYLEKNFQGMQRLLLMLI